MAVKRVWHGWTSKARADEYQRLLHDTVFPEIEAKRIPGYRKIELLRQDLADYQFAGEKHVFIGVSKNSPLMDRIDTFETIVLSMIESGEIKNIIVNYYRRHDLPVSAL